MKDWKAECAALRAELKEVRAEQSYEREMRERRQRDDAERREAAQRLIRELLAP